MPENDSFGGRMPRRIAQNMKVSPTNPGTFDLKQYFFFAQPLGLWSIFNLQDASPFENCC
jgi:hypothetical protein